MSKRKPVKKPASKPKRLKPGPTSAEELAFYPPMRADLESDTPRLIFADWLEERGDPRAEFIRVQCAIPRTDVTDPARAELESREAELREQYEDAWRAGLPKIPGVTYQSSFSFSRDIFHRGFTTAASFTSRAAGQAQRLLNETLVHEGACGLFRPERAILESELLHAFTSLEIRGPAALSVLSATHIDQLQTLNVQGAGLTAFNVPKSAAPPALRELNLGANPLGDAGVFKLAQWPGLSRVTSLNLANCQVSLAGLQALAGSPYVANLQTLYLMYNKLGAAGLEILAQSSQLGSLRNLQLGNFGLTRDVSAIARLTQITELNLYYNKLGVAGARSLAEHLPPGLQTLELTFCDVGDIGVAALVNSRRLGGLRKLGLYGNQITQVGAQALATAPWIENLKLLELRGNRLQGCSPLAKRLGDAFLVGR